MILNQLKVLKVKLDSPYVIPNLLNISHFPSLDGWRAIAIILVVLGHSKLTADVNSLYYKFVDTFIYAELGVRIFFVLSGFLITSLLIKEFVKTGKINIKFFFIKRILRIFPVLYLYLIVVAILNNYANLGLESDHFLGTILYLNNFNFFKTTWITIHTWSLAVEEQFYLIWPFLFSYFQIRLWMVCLFFIIPMPFFRIFWYFKPALKMQTLSPFLGHADSIFMGSLMAILLFKKIILPIQSLWKNNLIFFLSAIIIFFIYYFTSRGRFGFFLLPLSGLITNILISIILVKTIINTNSSFYKLLNHSLLLKIGVLSYSLYIWQQLFLVPKIYYNNFFNWSSFPLNMVYTFIAAYISYNFYEVYFLKFKNELILKNK